MKKEVIERQGNSYNLEKKNQKKKNGRKGTTKATILKARKKSKNCVHSRRYMVKKLNGYILKKKVKHKYLVKVQSFSGVKRSSMVDHVKPIIRDDKLDHVILHARPYGLRSGKSSSRITKSIMDLAIQNPLCH